MSLNEDLNAACSRIKHTPEQVDLYDIRILLRRAQTHIERQNELISRSVLPGRAVLRWLEDLADG